MLDHQKGILSKVLSIISEKNASILTINQNIPIHQIASVMISLDFSELTCTVDELLEAIGNISGATKVELVSIE